MPETVNPYRAPQSVPAEEDWLASADAATLRRERRYAAIGRVVVTWEKLRVVYNVALAIALLLVAVVLADVHPVAMLRVAVKGAVIANVCFCAGPVVDGYLTWLGIRSSLITGALFTIGTGLAMLLALVSLVNPGF